MRAIVKPDPPALDDQSFFGYALSLGNACGRFCAFCEKTLSARLGLFHKERGLLGTDAQLSDADWPSLLLICGDCAASINNFNSEQAYFWPDTPVAMQAPPFVYAPVNSVTITVLDPEENTAPIMQETSSAILVQISTDVDAGMQAAAALTYTLFRLNGHFFNENDQAPEYVFPYGEYISPSDMRMRQRIDVAMRAADAAQALVRGIPTIPVQPAYVQNLLTMIKSNVDTFGYMSTWQSIIASILNAADAQLLPQLIAFMTGDTTPPDRKRKFGALEQGIEDAANVRATKLRAMEDTLGRIIAVSG